MADSEVNEGRRADDPEAEDHTEARDSEDKWIRNKSKRSKIWQHFAISRDGKHVKCDHCPLVLLKYSSTSNQWAHLEHAHNIHQEKNDKDESSSTDPVKEGNKKGQQSIKASFAKAKKRDPLNMVLARMSAIDR